MRKVLIPTDLSAQSLKIAEEAFKMYPDEIIDVLLVYPYHLPLWSSELYWFSPVKIITEHTDEHFARAKDDLVRKYFRNISSIYTELFIVNLLSIILYIELGSYFEERSLLSKFGKQYAEYQVKTYKYIPFLR